MTFLGSIGDAWERNVAKPWRDSGIAESAGYGKYDVNEYKINDKAFGETKSQKETRDYAIKRAAEMQRRQAPTMQAATINQMPQDQFRQGEMTLAHQLAQQASGLGPSLAQSQLRQATDRNLAQQMAIAASGRGGANPLAMRRAALGQAQINQQAAAQSADLRMQEQMAARQQLGSVLGQGRSADIGLAQSQANLAQQAAMQNQQASLQQTGLNDAQARFYDQARFEAGNQEQSNAMALEQLKVQQNLGLEGLRSGAYQNSAAANRQLVGGLIGGVASMMFSDGGMVPEAPNLKTQLEDPAKEKKKKAAKKIAKDLFEKSLGGGDNKSSEYSTGEALGQGVGAGLKKLFGKDEEEEEITPKSAGTWAGEPRALPGGAMYASEGGKIPGRASVKGDDTKNDKVPAMLSPGEVVVPRTVVEEGPDAARDFVAHIIKKNKKRRSDDELFKLAYGGRAY